MKIVKKIIDDENVIQVYNTLYKTPHFKQCAELFKWNEPVEDEKDIRPHFRRVVELEFAVGHYMWVKLG